MKRITFLLFTFTSLLPSSAQELRSDIDLSDPFIMADARSQQYYMTGTGGGLWRSGDLEVWTYLGFPLQFNEAAWMGASPQVWASEIHCIDGKYYNFSTLTNGNITAIQPSTTTIVDKMGYYEIGLRIAYHYGIGK